MRKFPIYMLIALATLYPSMAAAYIGPGLGAGAIAVVLGILAAIGMAFAAVLWYPIKRLVKRRKPKSAATEDDNPPS